MKYKSNIQKVVARINSKLKNIGNNQVLLRTVATYLKASNLRRVHNDGKSLLGADIGRYSTHPAIYVNPKNSPKKFTPHGKPKNKKVFKKVFLETPLFGHETGRKQINKSVSTGANFKNGKPRKTGWFESYKDFRQKIGRETSVVNLQLSGKLKNDWKMEADGKNYVIGFTSEYGRNVSHGLEKHFHKKIWGISPEDEKQIRTIVIDFIKNKLNVA